MTTHNFAPQPARPVFRTCLSNGVSPPVRLCCHLLSPKVLPLTKSIAPPTDECVSCAKKNPVDRWTGALTCAAGAVVPFNSHLIHIRPTSPALWCFRRALPASCAALRHNAWQADVVSAAQRSEHTLERLDNDTPLTETSLSTSSCTVLPCTIECEPSTNNLTMRCISSSCVPLAADRITRSAIVCGDNKPIGTIVAFHSVCRFARRLLLGRNGRRRHTTRIELRRRCLLSRRRRRRR